MNVRKEKMELYKAIYVAIKPQLKEILTEEQCIIIDSYLYKSKGLIEIAESMHFTDYHVVKDELEKIKSKILSIE